VEWSKITSSILPSFSSFTPYKSRRGYPRRLPNCLKNGSFVAVHNAPCILHKNEIDQPLALKDLSVFGCGASQKRLSVKKGLRMGYVWKAAGGNHL